MSTAISPSVTTYDFRRAGDFPVEVEAYLSCWYRSLCDALPDRWAEFVSFALDWKLTGLESARPFEAFSGLPSFAVAYRIVSKLNGAAMLLIFPRPLALSLVVGMLGDNGQSPPADRELTALENSLAETAIVSLVDVLNDSQPTLEANRFRYDGIELHPQRTRLFAADGRLGVVRLELTAPFGQREAWLFLSEKILDAVDETVQTNPGTKRVAQAILESLVRDMPVEVVVQLGSTALRVSELTELRAGDVLVLDQRITEPLQANVNGQLRYYGWPGRAGSRQAFQIDSLLDG